MVTIQYRYPFFLFLSDYMMPGKMCFRFQIWTLDVVLHLAVFIIHALDILEIFQIFMKKCIAKVFL